MPSDRSRIVADPLLERRAGPALVDRLRRRAAADARRHAVCIAWLFIEGIGIWGVNTHGGLGLRHRQLRLVDRHRQCRHADLGAAAADPAALARLDQPLRRGDDAVRRGHRRPVPDPASRPAATASTGSRPTRTRWSSGRNGAARWSGISGRSSATSCSRILFWYVGLIPDLATHARPRARPRGAQLLYGVFALGWRGSARHWQRARHALPRDGRRSRVPLVVSVHSVVGLDFAASLMPGWQETIFPPYFVVGAHVSPASPWWSMLAAAAALGPRAAGGDHRAAFRRHGARSCSPASIVMGMSYATEWFTAWYGGERAERELAALPVHRRLCAALLDRCSPATCWCRSCSGSGRLRAALLAAFVDRASSSMSACGWSAS